MSDVVVEWRSGRSTSRDGLALLDATGRTICGASFEFLQYVASVRRVGVPPSLLMLADAYTERRRANR